MQTDRSVGGPLATTMPLGWIDTVLRSHETLAAAAADGATGAAGSGFVRISRVAAAPSSDGTGKWAVDTQSGRRILMA